MISNLQKEIGLQGNLKNLYTLKPKLEMQNFQNYKRRRKNSMVVDM